MKSIKDLKKEDLEGKRVLLRLDLNVPVLDGKVTDDYRIVSALPTIRFLQENGAKIIVVAHCESNVEGALCTLKPAVEKLRPGFFVLFSSKIGRFFIPSSLSSRFPTRQGFLPYTIPNSLPAKFGIQHSQSEKCKVLLLPLIKEN